MTGTLHPPAGAPNGSAAPPGQPAPPAGRARRTVRRAAPYLGVLPFLCYLGLFLLWPTAIVLTGAFQDAGGGFTMGHVHEVATRPDYLDAFVRSILLSAGTALAGAVLGALLSWAVVSAPRNGPLRRTVVAASGVLAQFGGVMLAFAFLATFGFNGLVTLLLKDHAGLGALGSGTWLYQLSGLGVVYTYFQIPLMLIVFLPALDGLQRQWREASDSLGGTAWTFWRDIGGPVLAPSFLSSALLLFANAFSSYSTAAALISQGRPLVSLQIGASLNSEVALGQEGVGKALALGMVLVVAVVMSLYALVQRKAARWRQ